MFFPDYRDNVPEQKEESRLSGDEIRGQALHLKKEGASREEVLQHLRAAGVENEVAVDLTSELFPASSHANRRRRLTRKGTPRDLESHREAAEMRRLERTYQEAVLAAGRRNMMIGGAICVVGLLVTIATFAAAANSSGGGKFIIAWGAVVFGAIQFFRGLSQAQQGR